MPHCSTLARPRVLASVALALAASCATAPDTVTVLNQTGGALQPYEVVNLQRVAVGDPVRPGGTYDVDVDGFNPVLYALDPVAPGKPNGFAVQIAFDLEPRQILTVVHHYPVPPDQSGTPTKIKEELLNLAKSTDDVVIEVTGDRYDVTYVEK